MAFAPQQRYLVVLLVSAFTWAETAPIDAGKKVFVERCSSCHSERGNKPLATGLPLSDRTLSDDQLARAVSGRLKNSPDEVKRAVALYIRSFQKQ